MKPQHIVLFFFILGCSGYSYDSSLSGTQWQCNSEINDVVRLNLKKDHTGEIINRKLLFDVFEYESLEFLWQIKNDTLALAIDEVNRYNHINTTLLYRIYSFEGNNLVLEDSLGKTSSWILQ